MYVPISSLINNKGAGVIAPLTVSYVELSYNTGQFSTLLIWLVDIEVYYFTSFRVGIMNNGMLVEQFVGIVIVGCL